MTREEAYRLAMRACEETWNEKTCKQIKEALEQEPCEDAISREGVLSIIEESKEDDTDEWMGYPWKVTPNLLMDEVRKLPPVHPIRPSVIEDIKAEIKQKREENRNGEYDKIYELCLLIIDKHTSGK